jgi:glucose-1-phosphate adenylyltransferase
MDPRQMVDQHIASGAGVTVAGIRVPIEQASEFGVIEAGDDGRTIRAFREKPSDPAGLADAPHQVFASMGNYVFSTDVLVDAVTIDAADESSSHDIGGNLIPALVDRGEAQVYDFTANVVPGVSEREHSYWRDVGTIDAFYDAHMDLVSVDPVFDLYNREWPILSWSEPRPPAKFLFEDVGRTGHAVDSMVSAGVIVSGATVRRSILSPDVHLHSYSEVGGRFWMHGVDVGGMHRPARNRGQERSLRGRSAGRSRRGGRPRAVRRVPGRSRRDPQGCDRGGLTCGWRCSRASTRRRSTAARASTSSTSRASSPASRR